MSQSLLVFAVSLTLVTPNFGTFGVRLVGNTPSLSRTVMCSDLNTVRKEHQDL